MVDEVKTDQVQPELTPATPAPVVPPQPQPVQVDEGIKPGVGASIAVPKFDQKPNFVSVEDKKPTWGETARALWNENDFNVIGKAVYNFTYPPAIDHTPDPDFNPLKEAEGTPLAGQTPYLIGFKNKAELDYAIQEARQREHDRETIAANGALGVGLSFVNGGISPAALLPIALGPKSIGQFGRAALSGTVGAAAMEPFYQANDPGRTYEDAIKSMAASTIVAGVLGKGIMYVGERKVKALEDEINKIRENAGLNAGQNPIATYDLDNQLAPNAPTSVKIMRDHNGNTAIWDGSEYVDISDNMNPNVPLEETIAKHYGIEDINALKRTDTPRVEPEIIESPVVRESPEFDHHEAVSHFNDNEEVKLPDQATGTGGGLSAQASDTRNLVQKEITPEFLRPVRDKAGEVIAGLAKTVPGGHYVADTYTAIGRFAAKYGKSPVGIIMEHSYSKAARSLLLDVVDTSRQLIGDEVKALGGALSNHVQVEAERIQVEGLIALEDAYAQHRYGTTNPGFRQRGSGYWPGAKPEGTLEYKDFNERVFMAMNKLDNDVEGDPNVTKAAREIRKLLDPWLERGKKAIHDDGLALFSEDMHAPLGADSWISHQLDAFKVDNNWEGFVGMIYKHLQRDQVVKAEQKEQISLAQRDVSSAQAARDRIAGRIETLEQRMKENEIRFKERSMADQKSQSVEERAADRTKLLQTARKQIQEEIDALRDDSLPENRGTIKMLEEELKALKTEAQLSPSELDRIERQEVQDFVYNDEVVRQALEIAVGRRNRYEIPDFLQHIAENGGVADDRGDIMSALGGKNRVFSRREKSAQPQFEVNGKKSHPMYGSKKVDYSLITELNNSLDNPNTLDAWGHNFRSHNNEKWNMVDENGQMVPLDKETVKDEIINAIERGENPNPDWWNEGFKEHGINQLADSYIEAFKKMDAQPTSVREAVAALRNGDTGAARRLRSMLDAASQTGQAGESLLEAKLAYGRGKKHLEDLLKRRGVQDAKVKGAEGAERLVGSALSENKGRMRLLEERMYNQYEAIRALRIAEAVAEREHVTALDRREKLLMEWEGNSSKAFKNAVKDREAAAEAAGDIEGAPRRASADSAAEDAIRSILESERDYSDTELMTRANSIAHNWRGRPSTITDYLSEQDPFSDAIPTREGLRGSMKRRTIPIPIEDKIEFLQTDMRTVLGSIARSLPVDVMMTERYGSPEMTRMIDGVREDYDRMLSAERARRDKGFITQSEYKSLEKNMLAQMDLDLQQFTGLNQIMRNRYGYSSDPTNQGLVRVARGLRNWASLTSLGRATLNSFSDAGFGAALKYGVDKVFTDQWVSYGKVLADVPQELFTGKQTALVKQLKRESRALLIGTETMLTLMTHDIDHMTNMGMGNKFERTIAYGANRMQFLNGMTSWTDNVKMATMLMATQQFSDAAERMFKGKGTALDIARFAESNIQPHEAVEIGRMFDKYGSSERDVRFSNVDQWVENDAEKRAAMLYKVAMKREVNTIVPTSNIGVAPIWMSHPLAGILGQFMSFVYASHEQFYLANMQRLNYRMAGALAYGAGLGALSYYAYKISKGEKPTDNPGQLAKEVIDRMAIVPLYNELAKRVSKATMGQVDPYSMIGADQPLSRRADNDFFDEMLGPGLGVAKKGLQVAGGAAARLATGDPKYFQGKQLHQARQLAWFQNHFFGAPLIFDGGEKLGLKFMNLKPTPGQQRMLNGE